MGRFTNNHSIPGPPPQLCRQLRQHLGRGECAGLEASIVVWYALLIPIQVQIDPVMAQELKKLQPTYNLTKGQTATVPVGIELCKFGLGWDSQCDLDASCIGLKQDGAHAFTCYFGAKDPIKGVVTSSGDNTTGKPLAAAPCSPPPVTSSTITQALAQATMR